MNTFFVPLMKHMYIIADMASCNKEKYCLKPNAYMDILASCTYWTVCLPTVLLLRR